MEEILATFPEPTFHPGVIPERSFSARRRRNRRSLPIPPQSSAESTASVNPFAEKPNIFKHLSTTPFSFQIAYGQCGMSLKKRNDYLLSYKRSMLALGKSARSCYPHASLFPFEHQFQEVRHWFRKEHITRNRMKALLYRWLDKKYGSRTLNTEDPSTLCEPEKPVKIYDTKSRGLYTFEANALKRQINSQLGNNKWMFPEPQVPRNPLTNMELHLGQLISVCKQLKNAGETSWFIEALVDAKYNMDTFFAIHKTALKLHALEDLVKHPADEDLMELVEDFVDDEAQHHRFKQRAKMVTLYWAINKKYSDPYVRSWHALYRDYMRKLILHGNTYYAEHLAELDAIHGRSRKLLLSPELVKLAEQRLATIPKIEAAAPPPPPLPTLSVTLDTTETGVEREIVTVSQNLNLNINFHQTSVSFSLFEHFLSQLENMVDELDASDSPQQQPQPEN